MLITSPSVAMYLICFPTIFDCGDQSSIIFFLWLYLGTYNTKERWWFWYNREKVSDLKYETQRVYSRVQGV